jgi:VIT family
MGVGGFLASQAERDHYRYLRRTTQARVKRSCDGEVEREVHALLGPVGLDQDVSRRVAHSLLEVESGMDQSNGNGQAPASATDAEHGLRWSHSVGVTEFLLKFGEGFGTRLLPGRLYVVLIRAYLLLLFSAHFRSRGSSNAPPLPVCIYDWDGLSYWGHDPINSLLFYPDRAHRAHLLVHLNWYCSTYLRCRQGEGYWCSKQGCRWICMGRCKYVGGGRCGGSSGICHSCTFRGVEAKG